MKYTLFISAVVLFFCSCVDDSKNELVVIKATINSLEQSNKTIQYFTNDTYKQLYERLNDPKTADRAALWQPTAARITELSSSVIDYISKVRSQLIEATGEGTGEVSIFKLKNTGAVDRVFIKQGKGRELYIRLKAFTDSMHQIAPEINVYYNELIKSNENYLVSGYNDDKQFTETFFYNVSAAAALSLLAKFENDIRNTENKFVVFCFDKSTVIFCGYTLFQAIIGQSSNCVKAGDEIEITAGVGSFSTAARPVFNIDGKINQVDENGVVNYKFKTPLVGGKYSKQVKVEYAKPDGTIESKEYNIQYTVIDPNQK